MPLIIFRHISCHIAADAAFATPPIAAADAATLAEPP
jgi:hypothetical protein